MRGVIDSFTVVRYALTVKEKLESTRKARVCVQYLGEKIAGLDLVA